jgi:exodeoxyribonuclease VII small subunit
MSDTPQNLSYEQAFTELENIMNDLQNDEISVDVLSEKVQRASFLITHCNQMLRKTEKKVSDIIKELDI